MELTKNIFFNTDKLTQNSTVKISYTGELFQNDSNEVYIHYGFGLLWENLNEVKMEKTELGFQTEINLVETDLVVVPTEQTTLPTTKRLRKSYIWSKKIRIAVYKIITYLPKLISGNYKRKLKGTNA